MRSRKGLLILFFRFCFSFVEFPFSIYEINKISTSFPPSTLHSPSLKAGKALLSTFMRENVKLVLMILLTAEACEFSANWVAPKWMQFNLKNYKTFCVIDEWESEGNLS